MSGKHHNNFTLLRLIAALLVVVSHSYFLTGNEANEPRYIISRGNIILSDIGLYIFFFTSGYLVTNSLFNATNYRQFIYKRVLRIYPALIVAIIVTVFIIGPIVTILSVTDYFNGKQTWLYLLTITGFKIEFLLPGVFSSSQFFSNGVNGSLWTIALEMKLYLMLVLISICSYRKNNIRLPIISALLLLICVGSIAYHISFTTPFIDDKILKLIACFLIGSLVASVTIRRYLLKISLTILLLIALASSMLRSNFSTDLIIIFVICFGTYLFGTTKKLVMPLQTDLSYGIYIYAFPVQQALFQYSNFTISPVFHIITTLLITMPIALMSWKFIEHPALALKSKIS